MHSEFSASNSGESVSWHHYQLMCGWPETLPACNIGDQCATVDKVPRSLAMLTGVMRVTLAQIGHQYLHSANQSVRSWLPTGDKNKAKPCQRHTALQHSHCSWEAPQQKCTAASSPSKPTPTLYSVTMYVWQQETNGKHPNK